MSAKIDENTVRRVAKLSRLEMSDEQISVFSEQLSDILGYIEKLEKLDTENVEPLAHCLPVHNNWREDEVRGSLGVDKTLENSPDSEEEFFKVPKILDDSST